MKEAGKSELEPEENSCSPAGETMKPLMDKRRRVGCSEVVTLNINRISGSCLKEKRIPDCKNIDYTKFTSPLTSVYQTALELSVQIKLCSGFKANLKLSTNRRDKVRSSGLYSSLHRTTCTDPEDQFGSKSQTQ